MLKFLLKIRQNNCAAYTRERSTTQEHLRLPSPVQAVAGHAASVQCTTLHVKEEGESKAIRRYNLSVFKPFWAETIKLNPNSLLKPVQIWLACWACCLSYSWGNSGTALRKQAAEMPTSKPKMSRRHYFSFFRLLAHETSCTFAIGFQSNRIAFGTLLIERC